MFTCKYEKTIEKDILLTLKFDLLITTKWKFIVPYPKWFKKINVFKNNSEKIILKNTSDQTANKKVI